EDRSDLMGCLSISMRSLTRRRGNSGSRRTNTLFEQGRAGRIREGEETIVGRARAVGPTRRLRRDRLHPIAVVGDRQHVAGPQPTGADPPAVDPGPVGAAQIADPDLAVDLGQAAVPARDPGRVEPGIAIRMATDDDQRAIQADRGPSRRPGDGAWERI